jgi:hypothetical protein
MLELNAQALCKGCHWIGERVMGSVTLIHPELIDHNLGGSVSVPPRIL